MKAALWTSIGALVIVGLMWFASGAHAATCGEASWYGTESGNRTATGAYFDGSGMTAAMPSRSWLGARVRVTYRGRSVVVLIDDLGPAARLHRVIDLSRHAAQVLGLPGIGRVCVERIG